MWGREADEAGGSEDVIPSLQGKLEDEDEEVADILQKFAPVHGIPGACLWIRFLFPDRWVVTMMLTVAASFAPTILQGWNYSPIGSQLRTVPITMASFVLAMVVVAWFSDNMKHRYVFI